VFIRVNRAKSLEGTGGPQEDRPDALDGAVIPHAIPSATELETEGQKERSGTMSDGTIHRTEGG
jgi:hypothetical protein